MLIDAFRHLQPFTLMCFLRLSLVERVLEFLLLY